MSQASQILMAQSSQNSTRSAALARRKSMSDAGKAAVSNETDGPNAASPVHQDQINLKQESTRRTALARRKAMSQSGKLASNSKDRIRGQDSSQAEDVATKVDTETINGDATSEASNGQVEIKYESTVSQNTQELSSTTKAAAQARRRTRSAYGKATPSEKNIVENEKVQAVTSRDIARSVRRHRSNRGNNSSLKVGVSETNRGQHVTGTMVNRNASVTGNEASTCRDITGTEYLEANVYKEFCKSEPSPNVTRSGMSSTNKGNVITGNKVSRSLRVTGDEPGSCKNITGTDYISVQDSDKFCTTTSSGPEMIVSGATNTTTRKGKTITGDSVGKTGNVTGADAGANMEPTGAQYTLALDTGRSSTKQHMDRSETDISSGSTSSGVKKITFSETFDGHTISGNIDGRTNLVTGNEAGTCNSITGTPYSGLENYLSCDKSEFTEASLRAQTKLSGFGSNLTGIQPSIGGTMTGDHKGACEKITGTPYVGEDQIAKACSEEQEFINQNGDALDGNFKDFSIASPGHASKTMDQAFIEQINHEDNHVTGPFDMATGKVTGTDDDRFGIQPELSERNVLMGGVVNNRVKSRVSGEGIDAGPKITGDDWDRGNRITGTEGLSATVRNPSIRGPMNAMINRTICKEKNDAPNPTNLVTGSSGNYKEGSLITYSGGARG